MLAGRSLEAAVCSYRQNLVAASFGGPERLSDGSWPWGTTQRWIYYTPYAHNYNGTHIQKINRSPCWQHLADETLKSHFNEKAAASVTVKVGQAPENWLVFNLPHQSCCPLSWKLQKEESDTRSEEGSIGTFWRMSKIKSLTAEMQKRVLSSDCGVNLAC